MKTGFFRALWGSCAGTAIFDDLRFQHWGRAIWHLLLMTLIASLIMFWGIYPALKQIVLRSAAVVGDNCGELRFNANGIFPVENPNKERLFLIAGPTAVTYVPEDCTTLPENFKQGAAQGVIWNGSQCILWFAGTGGIYQYSSINGPLVPGEMMQTDDPAVLLKALKKSSAIKLNLPAGKHQDFSPSQIQAIIKLILPPGMILILFQRTLVEVVIYILMFSLVFLMMNFRREGRLKFMEMITLSIYAGFPAMIAGSVASALQLPVLTFNLVYVLGMTFYMVVIMNRLERLRQERAWRSQSE